MAALSYDDIIDSIRAGKIKPGDEIERSWDDEDLEWDFSGDPVMSFAVGIDIPGTYASEPYWGMYLRIAEGNLLFADLVTEGDGSDSTRFITTIGPNDSIVDLVSNFIISDDFEMQYAVFTHYESKKFEPWDYPPAEALDEFAWCRTTLSDNEVGAISSKLAAESPVYVAICEFFESPDDPKWQEFKKYFIEHDDLTKFYNDFKA